MTQNTGAARRPATFSNELERLAGLVGISCDIARTAERISGDLSGLFPVSGESDSDAAPDYLSRLRALLDGLEQSQARTRYAHQRISEALTDEVPAQATFSSSLSGSLSG